MRVKSTRGGRKRTRAKSKRVDLEKLLHATERRLEHAQEDVMRLTLERDALKAKLQPLPGVPEVVIPPEAEPT
jgi:hypothetical protein